MSNPIASEPLRRRAACPVCGRPSAAPSKPFCSQGCRDRDLLQWLGEGYKLPGPTAGTDTEE